MSAMKEVLVPDLGDVKEAGVIEVLVKPGDTVTAEQSLITLETEKATMEIPSPGEGVVKEIRIKVGDMVSTGTVILMLEGAGAAAAAPKAEPDAATAKAAAAASSTPKAAAVPSTTTAPASTTSAPSTGSIRQVLVPDLGDVKEAGVIEVLVKPGDTVTAEQSLITLETEKATMELPSPSAGVVKELHIKVGDMVSTGKLIVSLEEQTPAVKEPPKKEVPQQEPGKPAPAQQPPKAPSHEAPAAPSAAAFSANANEEVETPYRRPPPLAAEQPVDGARAHAGPSVRKFARELGVDLAQVRGSGPKGRVLAADVQAWVKNLVARGPAQSGSDIGLDLLPWPVVDFAKFGSIEVEPLSRIKKISGANLARNWVMIPHVTNNDVADITELESFRVQLNKENDAPGVKVTMLAFLIKACVAALKTHPQFNASLDGDNLVYKHYYNIGFAADTANGLVVPVVKDADKKGILEVAKESADLARQAREGKLKSTDMQGGTFSISSLGGIGGTTFTPIINAPEVAILGVSRSVIQPVWDGKAFQPRLQLPLSLSYDHRVIDGATAARFNAHLAQLLADFRRAML